VKPKRLVLQVVVAACCLALSGQLTRHLGLHQAAGLVSLAALSTLVIIARLGWKQALAGALALALLSCPVVLSQGHPLTLMLILSGTALGLGLTARWQLQPVYWLLMVSVCMATFNPPLPPPPSAATLIKLVGLLALCCSISALTQGLLLPPAQGMLNAFSIQHSWRRSLVYGLLLALCTLVTSWIALQHHWHITGLWLVLTPFLVLRPFVKDAWRVALHRGLGSIAGITLVGLLALVLPQGWPLQVPAVALGATTALVAARHGHPALMVMPLTATIVLFNSTPADLLFMADERLQANVLGLAVALGVMSLAHPMEWYLGRRQQSQDPTKPGIAADNR
jgi:hypothetical protein